MSDPDTFDPTSRRLCPDGACIGVIDDAGRCSACGRTLGADGTLEGAPEEAAFEAAPDAGAGFDAGRPLCPDGACVGVIGGDGRCGVCGRAV